jgi:DNA segregation ATPase FtsK/SpoIIIE, S-DNA-T family
MASRKPARAPSSRPTKARASRPTTRRTTRSRPSFMTRISPEVVRSVVGTALMAIGAITLIALLLPGEGALTDWWRDSIAPWFETGRWLLPFLLLGGGWYIAAGPGKEPGSGWGMTLLGLAIFMVGVLGAFEVLSLDIFAVERGGGRIGRFISGTLEPLLTAPGTFVLCSALAVLGVMLAFNLRLRQLTDPVTGTARWVVTTTADSMRRAPDGTTEARATATKPAPPTKGADRPPVAIPVESGADGTATASAATSILDEPAPRGATSPVSQTVWTGPTDGGSSGAPARLTPNPGNLVGLAGAGLAASASARTATAVIDAEPTAFESLQAIDWDLPTVELLEPRPAGRSGGQIDHAANRRRIEEKLLSFAIPAKVVAVNSGPVVTQYEVKPDHHVKVSRIEALADDLAMALSARSIRIEAPIPGKDVVGIEIPNSVSEVVGFRPLVDDSHMTSATSPLTFALGRDVSGKAYAVDLAKMPHLLVAGATGSGKSVCVNALITSILMRARPDEVRMVLVDLKRVELAPYNGLPHLLQHVIVEPTEAKGVLNWAVREMEERYKQLAAHGVRNIGAFNERPDLEPSERMPYLVLIIDELADLIMREGRKVEDPIVKIAQKARAVGIHLVLATQRPSVNVVTGLIKANVPSRIAFAMASMVDSRTVLDSPGAEDLIGRGDMLYQPSDLPRPIRMQGVFVSDPEIGKVVEHWKDQIDDPHYDLSIIETGDEGSGRAGDANDEEADRLLPDAIEVIREYDRASASLLQRRLKVGYARAARMIDQLEARGYIGAFDGSNARAVLRRDSPSPAGAGDEFDGEDE